MVFDINSIVLTALAGRHIKTQCHFPLSKPIQNPSCQQNFVPGCFLVPTIKHVIDCWFKSWHLCSSFPFFSFSFFFLFPSFFPRGNQVGYPTCVRYVPRGAVVLCMWASYIGKINRAIRVSTRQPPSYIGPFTKLHRPHPLQPTKLHAGLPSYRSPKAA